MPTGIYDRKKSKPNLSVFKKRHIPWNKNIKGIHLSLQSEFSKGQTPWKKGLVGGEYKEHYLKGFNGIFQKGERRSPDTEFKKGDKPPWTGKRRLNISGENHPNWKGGTSNYLKTTIQKAQRIEKAECNRCKWNQFVDVLQTHHRDRDRSNNSSSNLEVLCPTCHYSEHYQAHDGIYWNNKIVNMS